jgi:uncharacterized repeat protein (TIGR01451 family)
MFTQRSSGHSKVVAFIVVLAMIMMYTFSFAGIAFAGPADELQLQLKDHPQAEDIDIPDFAYVAMKVQMLSGSTTITGIDFQEKTSDSDWKFWFDFKDASGTAIDFPGDQSWTYMGIAFFDDEPTLAELYDYDEWISITQFLSGTPGRTIVMLGETIEVPTSGSITINKDVLTSTGQAVVDTSSSFAFSVTGPDEYSTTFAITDGGQMIFTLPFGEYVVTETGYGNYIPQTTQTSLSISSTTPTAVFTFENWQPGDTPPPTLDIDISKSVTVGNNTSSGGLDVYPGDAVEFTIEVTNNEATTLYAIEVEDIWPDELIFTGYSPSGANMTSSAGIIWTWIIAELAAGATETLTMTGTVPTDAEADDDAYNDVEILSVGQQELSGYWDNAWVTVIDPPADGFDIEVEKTVDDTRVYRNQTVIFTVTVTNNGPDTAYEVLVTDLFPMDWSLLNPL